MLRFNSRDGKSDLFPSRELLEVEADDASSRCQGAYHNVDHSLQQARNETDLI